MFKRNERGAVAPLIALMLFVIIICIALVVDLGRVHSVKAELQRTVDAAALAGVRYLPNETSASNVSTATAGQSRVDGRLFQDLLDDGEVVLDIVFGKWDPNLTDVDGNVQTHEERFDQTATMTDAVYVRATQNVDHVFFFFTDSTPVTADAIAVQEPINPVSPLSIISCIPLEKMQGNPGELPGLSPCDIDFYTFESDPDDSAAWSSLTLQHGANNINDIITNEDQQNLFEQLVFGFGLNNDGIENTNPKPGTLTAPPAGCDHPMGTNINCGLGKIAGAEIAPPNIFPIPSGASPSPAVAMPTDANGVYQPYSDSFDPLFGYAQNGALPRWYNFYSDGEFKTNDHFLRIWSQDGFLLKGSGETALQYQARLQSYYDGSIIPPAPFDDGRFLGADGFIKDISSDNAMQTAIANHFTNNGDPINKADVKFFPNFMKLMQHAGYPQVGVTNGNVTSVLANFFSQPQVAVEPNLQCSDNEPLDSASAGAAGGQTLRLQVPVIFAGFCESWKALSNGGNDHVLVYIGLADLLLTRGWKGNNDYYACPGPDYVNVAGCADPLYPPSTPSKRYPPIPASGDLNQQNEILRGIEGLIKTPKINTSEAMSTTRIFLVE